MPIDGSERQADIPSHCGQSIRHYMSHPSLLDLFPCRLSQAEELGGVHSGERHPVVYASLIHSKIVRPRCTLTPK
jgi:hypothetical protein